MSDLQRTAGGNFSASDWTRFKRTQAFRPMPHITNISAGIPGNAPPDNGVGSSSTFVLACIDPRFASALTAYLDQELAEPGYYTYDLFILAGAALGGNLVGPGSPTIPVPITGGTCTILSSGNNWFTVLCDHIQVAILLHDVTNIIMIDHLDCGAYKNCAAAGDDIDATLHQKQFNDLVHQIGLYSFLPGPSSPFTYSGYYFSIPVDAETTLVNYTSGPTIYTEPFPTNNTAKVLILGCIDPRFIATLTNFLVDYKEVQFIYDLFILAGSSLGANQSFTGTFPATRASTSPGDYPGGIVIGGVTYIGNMWGPTFFDHLSIARLLHQITEVWIFDHLDCGAYKNIKFNNPAATDTDPAPHTIEIVKLAGFIDTYTSSTDYLGNPAAILAKKGFVMDKQGIITKVYDDGGISFNPAPKQYGSSIIRSPASDYTNRRLFLTTDIITQLASPSGSRTAGNSVQVLEVTRSCDCEPVRLYSKTGICINCKKGYRRST